MLSREAANTNIITFDLTELMISHTPGKHANHYSAEITRNTMNKQNKIKDKSFI